MRRAAACFLVAVVVGASAAACSSNEVRGAAPATTPGTTAERSYAIYGEYAVGASKVMQPGLNRRVFNTVEAQEGTHIGLDDDGSISLQPGTYRITGLSITSMQSTFAPPEAQNETNYPGYALVYPTADETDGDSLLDHAIGIGTPQTALEAGPSEFDLVYTTDVATSIAVGHQSGEELHDEVYLTVYDVEGIPSDYHVFARVSVTEL